MAAWALAACSAYHYAPHRRRLAPRRATSNDDVKKKMQERAEQAKAAAQAEKDDMREEELEDHLTEGWLLDEGRHLSKGNEIDLGSSRPSSTRRRAAVAFSLLDLRRFESRARTRPS